MKTLSLCCRHPDGDPAIVVKDGVEVIRAGSEVTFEKVALAFVRPKEFASIDQCVAEDGERLIEKTKPKGSKWDNAPGFRKRRK